MDKLKSFAEIASINMRNSRTVCVSEAVRKHLMESTRIKTNLLRVITNGIVVGEKSYQPFQLARAREEISADASSRIIITVGRLSEEKGLDVLLAAFSKVAAVSDDTILAIVGGGPLEEALKTRAVDLKIGERVRFLGFKEDVFPYLAVSHIYASPSRYEGLPMSLLEAMSMRVPVVATRVGGVAEVVEDGVTGILIEPEAPGTLAETILALLDDEALAERLRANGLARVRKRFDISATVRDYERLYDECLLKRRGCSVETG
jgi:glycosyltransferase involved in cell wall biosynthesis